MGRIKMLGIQKFPDIKLIILKNTSDENMITTITNFETLRTFFLETKKLLFF